MSFSLIFHQMSLSLSLCPFLSSTLYSIRSAILKRIAQTQQLQLEELFSCFLCCFAVHFIVVCVRSARPEKRETDGQSTCCWNCGLYTVCTVGSHAKTQILEDATHRIPLTRNTHAVTDNLCIGQIMFYDL